MAAAAKITSKGQVTIPAEVREALSLREGDRLEFVESPDGWRVRAVNLTVGDLRGFLGKTRRKLSGPDIDDAIGQAVVERSERVGSSVPRKARKRA